MKKLFFDIQITGHHTEYISHILNYIVNNEIDGEFFFIVNEELKVKFPNIIQISKNCSKIRWEFVSKQKIYNIHSKSLLKRSFAELALVEEYSKKLDVKEVNLLYFNIFQIALIFKRPSFIISGILFLQFMRMPKNNLKNLLKYYRKYFTTKLLVYNKKIKNVYILNDEKSVNYLNKVFDTTIFKMLPDPIPIYIEEKNFNLHNYYNIDKQKKILLHPGAIDPRKGVYEIIESVDFLQENEINNYAILIVGKAKPEIVKLINEKIKKLNNKDFTILFDNTFVSNERLKSLFLQSYAVLIPYKNPEASSGILGHAVIANKCVLGPKSGLLGDLIESFRFGTIIPKVTPLEVAKGIKSIHNYQLDKNSTKLFLDKHTVDLFSSLLVCP